MVPALLDSQIQNETSSLMGKQLPRNCGCECYAKQFKNASTRQSGVQRNHVLFENFLVSLFYTKK